MKNCFYFFISILLIIGLSGCHSSNSENENQKTITKEIVRPEHHRRGKKKSIIKPVLKTEAVKYDSEDPAIWVNHNNPAESLILGTDKKNEYGALYVFDLQGKVIENKVVRGLNRPNSVDVEYGLMLNGKPTDIAVVTERVTHKIRVFSLPDMDPVDRGGISVFEGESKEGTDEPSGIALYKRPSDKAIFAILTRKDGPEEKFLWQYRLEDDGKGTVKAKVVRKFGKFSGEGEIEEVVADDSLGYVYYSDENIGVRKYYADPDKGDEELALFATKDVTKDREGLSIYNLDEKTGYILLSDQQANQFLIFPREGSKDNPHQHDLIKTVKASTNESDGSEICSVPLNVTFQKGLFVAMSSDKSFQLYRWEDIAGKELKMIQ